MKKIFLNKIINIENTDLYDNRFLFDYLSQISPDSTESGLVEVFYLSDILETKKNIQILEKVNDKPAMYSNVYSPEDEIEIFKSLFENAMKNNKKIHII
jgi:hypothetical protein